MKVLLVEPGKHPRTVEIEHTLEAMYQVLDCDTITATYPWPDRLALVTDDEGMLSDRMPCRYIRELEQPIACLRSDMYTFFSQNCSWTLIASVVSDIHFKCGTAQEITNRHFLSLGTCPRSSANYKNKINRASKCGNQVIRLNCGCKRVKAGREGIQSEVILKSILKTNEGQQSGFDEIIEL